MSNDNQYGASTDPVGNVPAAPEPVVIDYPTVADGSSSIKGYSEPYCDKDNSHGLWTRLEHDEARAWDDGSAHDNGANQCDRTASAAKKQR
jgi:hypothetical protein